MKFLLAFLLSFNLYAIPISNEAIVEADQLTTLDSTYVTVKTALELDLEVIFTQMTTPSNPSSGFNKLYFKSDDKLYGLTSAGVEASISGDISPTTTQGDIIVRGASVDQRLAAGTSGDVLTSNGAGVLPSYETPTGGSVSFTTVTKTGVDTLLTTGEDNVICDASGGDFTLTLPAASGNSGLTYKLTSKSTGKTTIDGNASETIGGELTVILASKDDSIIITTDGTSWFYLNDDIVYAARYTSNNGQAIGTSEVIVNFEDKAIDTHDAVTIGVGTWVFTAPIDGLYRVNVHTFLTNGGGWDASEVQFSILKKNGSNHARMNTVLQDRTHTTFPGSLGGTTLINLLEGDTTSLGLNQGSGASLNLQADGTTNYIDITRIK